MTSFSVWDNDLTTLLGCRYPVLLAKTKLPLVAAGGIAKGDQILAAMQLGAQGVSCGTAFLATAESYAHDYHKERIVSASAESTVLTRIYWKNWHRPEPVRVIRNELTAAEDAGSPDRDETVAYQDGKAVLRNSTDSPLRGASGDLNKMALYAGHSCSHIHRVVGARDRLLSMIEEAEALLRDGFATAAV